MMPIEPGVDIDVEKTREFLLDDSNFKDLHTVRGSDMPRVSQILRNYHIKYFNLIHISVKTIDSETGRALFSAMRRNLPEEIIPMDEALKRNYQALEDRLREIEDY